MINIKDLTFEDILEPVDFNVVKTNAAAMGVNLGQLRAESPLLYKHLCWTLGISVDTAARCMKSYKRLVERGALQYDFKRNEKINARIKEIVELTQGPCLIPKDSLEDLIITQTRRGKTEILVDYMGLQHEISQAYALSMHGLFDNDYFGAFAEVMGYTMEVVNQSARNVPVDDDISMELVMFQTLYHMRGEMPYVNLWHLFSDFIDIENGCKRTLDFPATGREIEVRVGTGVHYPDVTIPECVFQAYLDIIHKELQQVLPECHEITFMFEW